MRFGAVELGWYNNVTDGSTGCYSTGAVMDTDKSFRLGGGSERHCRALNVATQEPPAIGRRFGILVPVE